MNAFRSAKIVANRKLEEWKYIRNDRFSSPSADFNSVASTKRQDVCDFNIVQIFQKRPKNERGIDEFRDCYRRSCCLEDCHQFLQPRFHMSTPDPNVKCLGTGFVLDINLVPNLYLAYLRETRGPRLLDQRIRVGLRRIRYAMFVGVIVSSPGLLPGNRQDGEGGYWKSACALHANR